MAIELTSEGAVAGAAAAAIWGTRPMSPGPAAGPRPAALGAGAHASGEARNTSNVSGGEPGGKPRPSTGGDGAAAGPPAGPRASVAKDRFRRVALATAAAGRLVKRNSALNAAESHARLLQRVGLAFRNTDVIAAANKTATHVHRPRMLYPEDSARVLWDMLVMVLVVYSALLLPYVVAFLGADDLSFVFFDYAVDFAFCLDVFLNFRTAFVDDVRG
jgi:hypothetical protein